MKPAMPPKEDSLDRRGWLLWALTFVVLIALTGAVQLLYAPSSQALHEDPTGLSREDYAVIVGLGGLVVLFCLYNALKHGEIRAMRRRFEQHEREKEDVRTRLSELSALFQLATSLNLQLGLTDILELIVHRVVSTLRAQQASIMVYNPETGLLETRATYGLESEFAKNARMRLGEGIAGWVAQRREAVQLDSDSAAFRSHYKPNRNITSALSLPLKVGERCVGVLNVNRINHPDRFQRQDRELLTLFADHVGSVVERAEVVERLGVRARELEAVNLKLSEMNHLKDVFLSAASYELKTPLAAVIGYAELLADNDATLSHGQRAEFLRRLRGEAGRLLGLIEDILDLSRIESGKLALRCVSMSANEIAHAAVETTRPLAAKHDVELVEQLAPGLPPVALDEVKMRQVLVNLLVYAVKFSPERGRVTIATRLDDGFVRIEVTDQGQGVTPEDATHIFELFGQDVQERSDRGGLGIGLHLVKRLAELHGGHVGVNSRVGEGSTFWVRLPMQVAEDLSAPLDGTTRKAA